MRKPVYAICEQQWRRSDWGDAQTRSLIIDFVVRCLGSIIPLVYVVYIRNFKPLPSFCGCAGPFVSYLVANFEDRFSRDEAQVIHDNDIYEYMYMMQVTSHHVKCMNMKFK